MRVAAKCIICDGPFPDSDGEDEFPVWFVALGDEVGNPIPGSEQHCRSFDAAIEAARAVKRSRPSLELVIEATPD
jgi:hypothetical protein